MEQSQLVLTKVREFGDVISDGFKILKINFRVLLQGFLLYIMPFFVIGMVAIKYFSATMFLNPEDVLYESNFLGMFSGIMVFGFSFGLAYIFFFIFLYSLFVAYERNDSMPVDFGQVQNVFKEIWLKILGLYLIILFIIIVPFIFIIGGLSFIGPIAVVIAYLIAFPVLIYAMIPMQFFPFVYIREKLSITASMKRSFYLVKNHWWVTFGVHLISSIMAGMLSNVFLIPIYIVGGALVFPSLIEGGDMENSAFYGALCFMVYAMGALFCSSYNISCSLLKYYDLAERKDSSSMISRIDQLGENKESMFENEGDF